MKNNRDIQEDKWYDVPEYKKCHCHDSTKTQASVGGNGFKYSAVKVCEKCGAVLARKYYN